MLNIQNEQFAAVKRLLADQHYIADEQIAISVFLSMELKKPLLIEGPAGVGKTEIAKVMAKALDTKLIRLQCYEGLDANQALYEWNYQQQLLHLKIHDGEARADLEKNIFSEKFLLKRPLLEAITCEKSPVLLIDEVDRSDEEFESLLLEILSDWQISIPEIGTIQATHIPYVVVTSNRVRELSEALRRRCMYLYIDYPDFQKELVIIRSKVPTIDTQLATQITAFMQALRQQKLNKIPGIAEAMDWAKALTTMHFDHLDKDLIERTLGVILKDWQDVRATQTALSELMEKVGVIAKI